MTKKVSLNIAAWLILVLLSTQGCKTYEYFSIDVLEPAEIYLPKDIEKILITHNAFPDSGNTEGTVFTIFGNTLSDTIYRDSVLAAIATTTLSEMLNQIQMLETETLDSLDFIFPDEPGAYSDRMVSKIKIMCQQKNADAFLIMTSLKKEIEYDIYYGNFGNTFGEFAVYMSSRWLLIDPFSLKLIDNKRINDTLYLPVSKPFARTVDDNYDQSIELLYDAAAKTGILYGSYLSPHYTETDRMIFTKGHKHIKNGYLKALQGDWKDAAFYWREALTVQNRKVQAKASFNMALANEMEGLLEPALEWAKESYRFFPDTLNHTYIKILEARLRDQKEIVQQMEKNN
jgi:tetratricopeptide (TPR) repeat protein